MGGEVTSYSVTVRGYPSAHRDCAGQQGALEGETKMADRPVATWMCKEDDVLRTAAGSGETPPPSYYVAAKRQFAIGPSGSGLSLHSDEGVLDRRGACWI
jgi:hypothetical protein